MRAGDVIRVQVERIAGGTGDAVGHADDGRVVFADAGLPAYEDLLDDLVAYGVNLQPASSVLVQWSYAQQPPVAPWQRCP